MTKPKKKKQDNLKDAVVWLSSSEYLQDIGSSGASLVGFPLHPIKKKPIMEPIKICTPNPLLFHITPWGRSLE